MPPVSPTTFHWSDCEDFLAEYAEDSSLELDPKRRFFASASLRIHPPLVFPIAANCSSLADYLARLPEEPGLDLVVLYQAGAASLGLFEAGEEIATKSFKRYVVRGKGRAQPSHLEAKGKSRYGSRLRLQNAKRLVEETNEKLRDWVDEFGAPEHIYFSSPVRLWPSLFEGQVKPPFEKGDGLRIPRDVPRPTSEVLVRTYRSLCWGRIERLDAEPSGA